MGFTNGSSAAAADSPAAAGGSRLKSQLSFSSRQGSLMSQISEMENEELGGSSPEGAGGGRGFIPGYPIGSGWEDSSSLMTENMSGMKRPRDSLESGQVRARPSRPLPFPLTRSDLCVVTHKDLIRVGRPNAPVRPAQDVVGDGRHREDPPVPGRRALQDPRQARVRHAPAQHRRAGKSDINCSRISISRVFILR
jgi:hypothetical protein